MTGAVQSLSCWCADCGVAQSQDTDVSFIYVERISMSMSNNVVTPS